MRAGKESLEQKPNARWDCLDCVGGTDLEGSCDCGSTFPQSKESIAHISSAIGGLPAPTRKIYPRSPPGSKAVRRLGRWSLGQQRLDGIDQFHRVAGE
jgi:hypothetical protein